ncbi:MAG: hypothetical protein ABIA04_10495 [Pseudomonadota bacterium]
MSKKNRKLDLSQRVKDSLPFALVLLSVLVLVTSFGIVALNHTPTLNDNNTAIETLNKLELNKLKN